MNKLNQYRQYQLDTVSMEDSIALIYDGARRFVDQALKALEAGDYVEVSQKTGRAQQILTELSVNLNMDAGEVAVNLAKMYEYWCWRLSQGIFKRDPEAFREVSGHLENMREAWEAAARQVRADRSVRVLG